MQQKLEYDGYQEKIEKKKAMEKVKSTSVGAVSVKDTDDSNVRKKKWQLHKQKVAGGKTNEESKSSLSSENKNVKSQTSTFVKPYVVQDNDKERLKIKLGDHISKRFSASSSNNVSDAKENVSEFPKLSSSEINSRKNAPIADEEKAHNVISMSSKEGVELKDDKGILNVGYDNQGYGNYEMPIATEVDLVEDIILVDAKVILGLFGMNVFQKCFLKYSVSFTNRLLIHGTSRRSFMLILSL